MLYITLMERVVERCNDLTSPNYRHVIKMYKRHVEGFSFSAGGYVIPRVGDVVSLSANEAYDVISVIHTTRCCAGLNHLEVILEVVPHVATHAFDAGSYSFEEAWPLISDLETFPNDAG